MLEKLKKLFGENLVHTAPTKDQLKYYWFLDDSFGAFGIKKKAVSEDYYTMLQLFFKQLAFPPLQLNEQERQWSQLLFSDEQIFILPIKEDLPLQFIQFQLEGTIDQPHDFKDALETFFSEKPFILWKNQREGVIISQSSTEEPDFHSIVQTLISDFYIDITIFVGKTFAYDENIKGVYLLEHDIFATVKTLMKKQVIYYYEALPIILIQNNPAEQSETLMQYILKHAADDKELLHTINVFIKSNLNVSLAAKELFMHRNSLQYRIDKFIDKTGIDIKQFEQALIVYLAIYMQRIETKGKK